jgi:uncharacterized membrane protein YhfC
MKSLDDYTAIAVAVLVLLIMIAGAWWWLPQKWQACQKLYDNRPAQIICMGSK